MKFILFLLPLILSCNRPQKVRYLIDTAAALNFIKLPDNLTTWPSASSEPGGAAVDSFLIGEHELTYQLWYKVASWGAENASYSFANKGRPGSFGRIGARTLAYANIDEPVTTISWGDAVIWSNALTDLYNSQHGTSLELVYLTPEQLPVRDAQQANSRAIKIDKQARGFRLPTDLEWELAARWLNGHRWLNPEAVAGSKKAASNIEFTNRVAWFNANSSGRTHPVKSKKANALGVYDLAGNVAEWVADFYKPGITYRVVRGGAYLSGPRELQIIGSLPAHPEQAHKSIGFRLAKSAGS